MAAETAPKFIDLEILGHMFEQPISDLEQLHQEIGKGTEGGTVKEGPRGGKRAALRAVK